MCQAVCELSWQCSETAGIPVVAAIGEVDIASAPAFRDALLRRITQGDPGRLIVDLTQVPFVDSEGLRALIAARTRCPSGVALVGVRTGLRRILTITGTERLFVLAPTREDAALLLSGRSSPGAP